MIDAGSSQKHICIGILAHVDAGKTTMSEAMLYKCGRIRTPGRVDHKNAYLDTDSIEKDRGITIFSKQAVFQLPAVCVEGSGSAPACDKAAEASGNKTAGGSGNKTAGGSGISVTLLDTPGHMDFSAEMERTLAVLDCAILVISGSEGVQAHTRTLWRLLKRHHIPTFVWVNKMDMAASTQADIIRDLRQHFNETFIDFTGSKGPAGEEIFEDAALCSEAALEEYSETGSISRDTLSSLIADRLLFPCWFGSALKMTGIEEFLQDLGMFAGALCCGTNRDLANAAGRAEPGASDETGQTEAFGAKVFKITHDEKGVRLVWLKVTGGSLSVRDPVSITGEDGGNRQEKVTQIRIYSGAKYETADSLLPGQVGAVTGLDSCSAGMGLGFEKDLPQPLLEPVLSYKIQPPAGMDPQEALAKLKPLAEEDPMLRIVWNSETREISIQLMGQVQTEVLTGLIADRFGMDVTIGEGRIMYRETIASPVEGMGHFEPLRHYAEVHLLMEPIDEGMGLVFESAVSPDDLATNWQRLVLTNLAEKRHKGVLTGAPLTDVRITLVAGRAHLKHTEGGDFRQATYRAVRQGLMKADNVLLEPYFDYILEIPSESVGRAMSDLKARFAHMESPITLEKTTVLTGRAPVSTLQGYQTEVLVYTSGLGHLTCSFGGYYPCHNTEKVIEETGYDPERDIYNSPDSVFCSHGAGVNVKWDCVEQFMHMDSGLAIVDGAAVSRSAAKLKTGRLDFDDKELDAIIERELGPIKRPKYSTPSYDSRLAKKQQEALRQSYIIVDGYNMVYAWDALREMAETDLNGAAEKLCALMADYAAFRGCRVSVVFDGYKVKGGTGSREEQSGIGVVYTKEGESADFYIEKLALEIGNNYTVKVATSDGMIQMAALRAGVLRMTAAELEADVESVCGEISAILKKQKSRVEFVNAARVTEK